MGTERVPTGAFDQIMEGGGGANNASTGFDRTNYFDWGPSSLLETLLWLEADRMEGLGKAMTQEKLDLQRMVVRNERREGYDNAPYGPSELLVFERMYPVDHPYHFHVIGSHEDLVAATVPDVVGFFDTYYRPNNATLVVAGDFDPAALKPTIQRLFGSIPAGGEPPRRSAPRAELLREERITVTDKVQLPRVTFVWHSPAFYAPGDAEMDLVAHALGNGESARLRRRLVREEQVAVDVAVFQYSQRLGSLFEIQVTAREGVPLERIESLVDEELAKVRADGFTRFEIQRGQVEIEKTTLSSLQSLREVADRLNHYDAYLGHPDSLARDLDRYRKATPESVAEAARRVLHPERRLVLRVVPPTPAEVENARDRRPEAADPRPFTPPSPEVHRLENGLEVWHLDRSGLPLLHARLIVPGGAATVPAGKAGLAPLVATLLTEGAGERDAIAFSDELDRLGATLSVGAASEDTTFDLEVLSRNAEPALGLLGDALLRPRFEDASFLRERGLLLEGLKAVADDPPALARHVSPVFYHPAEHPLSVPASGTPTTVAGLTPADVKGWHARHLAPAGARLLLVGDLRPAAARALVERVFGAWRTPAGAPAAPAALPPAPAEGLRVLVVDRPGAAQTVVRFLAPGVAFGHPDRAALHALNTVLGGSFTSRLNTNLREDKGYTYGAGSRFDMLRAEGLFLASANVESAVTEGALREFLVEFDRIRAGGVTAEEAEKAVASRRYDSMEPFERLAGVADAFGPYAAHGLPPSALADDLAALDRVTPEGLDALAARHVLAPGGALVLVGDGELVRKALDPFASRLGAVRVVSVEDALEGRVR